MHVSYVQDTEDQFRTHQALQSVPVSSAWTPPAHKRGKSTSAPFFSRGHRSLARSLNFDVLNLCCSRGIPSLSWFISLKIAFRTMIPPHRVCTGLVGNCRTCKLQCGWPCQRTNNTWCPTGSHHQQCSYSLLPRSSSASSHPTGNTSYQAFLQKAVWNVYKLRVSNSMV